MDNFSGHLNCIHLHAVREPHKHTIKLENKTEQTNSFTSSDKLTEKQIEVSAQIY